MIFRKVSRELLKTEGEVFKIPRDLVTLRMLMNDNTFSRRIRFRAVTSKLFFKERSVKKLKLIKLR